MNRRSFLKSIGVVVGGLGVAPSVIKAIPKPVEQQCSDNSALRDIARCISEKNNFLRDMPRRPALAMDAYVSNYPSGAKLYMAIWNYHYNEGKHTIGVWSLTENCFETADFFNLEKYAISMFEQDAELYVGDIPNLPIGKYKIYVFLQTKARPNMYDRMLSINEIVIT